MIALGSSGWVLSSEDDLTKWMMTANIHKTMFWLENKLFLIAAIILFKFLSSTSELDVASNITLKISADVQQAINAIQSVDYRHYHIEK